MSNEKIASYLKLVRETYLHGADPVVENALNAQRQVPDVAIAGFYELVRNVPDTAEERSPAGSWKRYWERNGVTDGDVVNKWPVRCSVCDCKNHAEHGAHVHDANGQCYIVPMCAEHNSPENRKPMLLRQGTVLVPVVDGGKP